MNTITMNKILNSYEGMNSYNIAGYQCGNIHLFDSTGIVYSTGCGWFQARKERMSSTDVRAIMIEEPTKKAKANFNSPSPFWINVKGKAELYIPAHQLDFVPKGEIVYHAADTYTSYTDASEITLECSWTTNAEEITRRVITVYPERCTRSELNALGMQAEALEAEFKRLRITEGYFSYSTFLQHFDITPKKK